LGSLKNRYSADQLNAKALTVVVPKFRTKEDRARGSRRKLGIKKADWENSQPAF
jgi:hypothetical protein